MALTLIKEDGTAKATPTSYASPDRNAYHEAHVAAD